MKKIKLLTLLPLTTLSIMPVVSCGSEEKNIITWEQFKQEWNDLLGEKVRNYDADNIPKSAKVKLNPESYMSKDKNDTTKYRFVEQKFDHFWIDGCVGVFQITDQPETSPYYCFVENLYLNVNAIDVIEEDAANGIKVSVESKKDFWIIKEKCENLYIDVNPEDVFDGSYYTIDNTFWLSKQDSCYYHIDHSIVSWAKGEDPWLHEYVKIDYDSITWEGK